MQKEYYRGEKKEGDDDDQRKRDDGRKWYEDERDQAVEGDEDEGMRKITLAHIFRDPCSKVSIEASMFTFRDAMLHVIMCNDDGSQ